MTPGAVIEPRRTGPHAPGATGALGTARKIAVLILGTAVLAVGVALLVLPGPAFLVIPAGLAILGTEFLWARRLLRYGKDRVARLFCRARGVPAS